MENKFNLEKKEIKIIKKSRKIFNLPIFGSSIHNDWIFILASSLFLLLIISAGAFLKYHEVAIKIDTVPEESNNSEDELNIEEIKTLISKLKAKEELLKKLE